MGLLIAMIPRSKLGAELEDHHYVTAAIQRGKQTLLPGGDDTIEVGDHIYLLSPERELGTNGRYITKPCSSSPGRAICT